MNKKIIFFDIDGTLVDHTRKISDSTMKAIEDLKKQGHKVCICTGRSLGQIPKEVFELGFDGYIGASGSYVECEGEKLYQHLMPKEDIKNLIEFCVENNILFSVQTKTKTLFEEKWDERYEQYFLSHFGSSLEGRENVDFSKNIPEEIEKIIYFDAPFNVQTVKEKLGKKFEVTALSFERAGEDCGEITSGGIHKAFGIQKILEYYDIDRKDCIAFGDGPNDFEMIEYANIGIAMGNAIPELKKVADMVTTSVTDNGIRNGLKRLDLI